MADLHRWLLLPERRTWKRRCLERILYSEAIFSNGLQRTYHETYLETLVLVKTKREEHLKNIHNKETSDFDPSYSDYIVQPAMNNPRSRQIVLVTQVLSTKSQEGQEKRTNARNRQAGVRQYYSPVHSIVDARS